MNLFKFYISIFFLLFCFSYFVNLFFHVNCLENEMKLCSNHVNKILNFISPSLYKPIEAQTIYDTASTINDSNTFYTKGVLSSVLFPNYHTISNNNLSSMALSKNINKNENSLNTSLYEFPKLISGIWSLNVTHGNMINFFSAFKLVSTEGLEKHFIELSNFKSNMSTVLNPYKSTTIFGYTNIKIDNHLIDPRLQIKIKLYRINTITINILNQNINNLLFNNPIYGVTTTFKNFKNDELLVSNYNSMQN